MAISLNNSMFEQTDVRETVTNTVTSSVAFNLDYRRYDSRFDAGNTVTGVFISPLGNKLYLTHSGGGSEVEEYTLSTLFDVSTAGSLQTLDVSGVESTPQGIGVSPDGTELYVGGNVSKTIYQYTMSTPWDLSTASATGNISIVAQAGSCIGLYIREDGKYLTVSDSADGFLHQYILTTAWDITTLVYIGKIGVGTPAGIFFNRDGSEFFVIDTGNNYVEKWSMTSLFNITTSSKTTDFTLYPTGTLRDLCFSYRGNKVYTTVGTYIQGYTIKRGWR